MRKWDDFASRERGDDPTPRGNGHDHTATRLTLFFGEEAERPHPLGTIAAGILYRGSLTLIYGPPKSGKSFLATDLALAIPGGASEWMGMPIRDNCPVLYVACEGHAGFWKRLKAARDVENVPTPAGFVLATGRPMLITADAEGRTFAPNPIDILAALERCKARGVKPGVIFVDTVFRSFGAGNVNSSQDMNIYLAALATLMDEGLAVCAVHHEIKSGGSPAGSVSLMGGADTLLHVWRGSETGDLADEASGDAPEAKRFWQIEMAKDDAETDPRAFRLKVVDVGLDADGYPASSCIVVDEGAAPDAKPKRGRPRSDQSDGAVLSRAIYQLLTNILADENHAEKRVLQPEVGVIRCVARKTLLGQIFSQGIMVQAYEDDDEKDKKRRWETNRKSLARALSRLKEQGKIAFNDTHVGVTPKVGQ